MRRLCRWFCCWSLLWAAAGCAGTNACHVRSSSSHGIALESALPMVEANEMRIDLKEVGTLADVNLALWRNLPASLHGLSAEDCQCLAAAASTQGNSLAAERRSIIASASKRKGLSDEEQVKVRVLRATELEARNSSASAALQIFYHLAEAEANLSVADRSFAAVEETLSKVGRMRAEDVRIPFDASELVRKQIDLEGKRVELEWSIGQLNGQLLRLLGMHSDNPAARIDPIDDWKVIVEPIDMASAVQEGLSQRPEVGLLEYLRRVQSAENLSVTRTVLSGASGLLGSQSKVTSMISLLGFRELMGQRRANQRELPVRQRQMAEYTEQRKQEIASDIRMAVLTVDTRLRQVALAKEASLSWERRIDELDRKRDLSGASFLDRSTAQVLALQAESYEIGRVTAWKIALVKLKESQGRLIQECESFLCNCHDRSRAILGGVQPVAALDENGIARPLPEADASAVVQELMRQDRAAAPVDERKTVEVLEPEDAMDEAAPPEPLDDE